MTGREIEITHNPSTESPADLVNRGTDMGADIAPYFLNEELPPCPNSPLYRVVRLSPSLM